MDTPSYCAALKSYLCRRTLEESGYNLSKKKKALLDDHCCHAFLAGVADSMGKTGAGKTVLVSDQPELLELCSFLLIRYLNTQPSVTAREKEKSLFYTLTLPAEALLNFSFEESNDDLAVAYYFRGVFIACGYALDPSLEYHLEIKPKKQAFFEKLLFLAAKSDIPFKTSTRRGSHLLYLKDSEIIADFLTLIGGEKYAMALMDQKIFKEIKNHTNRVNNYDQANLSRVIGSAQTAVEAIRLLREAGKLSGLTDELFEAARVREENPDLPLGQLCALCNPPVSKSGMHHRLHKLIELAKEL